VRQAMRYARAIGMQISLIAMVSIHCIDDARANSFSESTCSDLSGIPTLIAALTLTEKINTPKIKISHAYLPRYTSSQLREMSAGAPIDRLLLTVKWPSLCPITKSEMDADKSAVGYLDILLFAASSPFLERLWSMQLTAPFGFEPAPDGDLDIPKFRKQAFPDGYRPGTTYYHADGEGAPSITTLIICERACSPEFDLKNNLIFKVHIEKNNAKNWRTYRDKISMKLLASLVQ
jgi:hypothetical protein